MTQRERLMELLDGALKEHIGKSCNLAENIADHLLANGVILVDTDLVCLVTNREPIRTAFGMPLDELAELIRAKQERRIIVPPCKVGDTVYYTERNTLQEMRVEYGILQNGFTMTAKCLDKCDMCTIFCDPKKKACGVVFDYNVIGKTVFLTKEEAEKAMERSKQ